MPQSDAALPRWLPAITIAAVFAVSTAGVWFYRTEEQHLRQSAENELRSIAQLKAEQIAQWKTSRLNDAAIISDSPFFADAVRRWLTAPEPELAAELQARLESLRQHYQYREVLLTDAHGRVRLSLKGYRGPIHDVAAEALTRAFHERSPVLTDLHIGPGNLPAHTDTIAPLFDNSRSPPRPLAAVLLQSDAREFLFPLIQTWPVPSESAETLLVRREGDAVLFLNDLRRRGDTALKMRIPLGADDVAAMAARGRAGVLQGLDYRGVQVLSVVRPLADTSWFLVAKVDAAEILATWRIRSLLIVSVLLLFAVAAAGIIGMMWQRAGKAHFKALFQAEAEKRASQERYRTILMSVGDAVIVTDEQGRAELMNPVAESLTGWKQQEARGKPLDEIFRIIHERSREPVENPVHRVLREGAPTALADDWVLIARDGNERPIADSSAPIVGPESGTSGAVLVLRDQAAQRAAQRVLMQSEAKFSAAFYSAPIPMALVRARDDMILEMNDAASAFSGWAREDLVGRPGGALRLLPEGSDDGGLRPALVETGRIAAMETRFRFRNDVIRDGLFSAQMLEIGSEPHWLTAAVDITERLRAEEALRRQAEVDCALAELSNDLLQPDLPIQEACAAVLSRARQLTGSPHGLVSSVDPETGEQVVYAFTDFICTAADGARSGNGIHLAEGCGEWFDAALRERKVVIRDCPPEEPEPPQGIRILHPPKNLLAVPALAAAQPLGQIVVARAPEEYGAQDAEVVRRIADLYGMFLRDWRFKGELRESERRFRHISSSMFDIAYSYSAEPGGGYRFDWMTGAAQSITGYGVEEIKQHGSWRYLVHDQDLPRFDANVTNLAPGSPGACELRIRQKSGGLVWVRSHAQCVEDSPQPGLRRVYGALIDITERHEAEERLRLNAAIIDNTRDGVMITDAEARILAVNRAYTRVTGYAEAEMLGKNPRILQSGRHDPAFYRALWNSLLTTGHWQGEIWNRRKDGAVYAEWLTLSAVKNSAGVPTHYVAVFTDISKLKESEASLERLAQYDPLTDLPNRLLVQSRLEQAIQRALRRGTKIGVLFIDLDRFKTVNDSLGHPAGDLVLVGAAKRLADRLRKEDTLGRLGGDEFLVLLEQMQIPGDAARVARALLNALQAPLPLPNGQEVYISASMGISIYPDDGNTPAELIRNADTAMYRVKESGRNAYAYYTAAMTHAAAERLNTETRLRKALERREFVLHYQPLVSAADNHVLGVEALVRWQRSGDRLVLPQQFIPLAEETGLIVELGEWVLRDACRQAKRWLDRGLPFGYVAVNLSVRQFQRRDLEDLIRGVLQDTRLPADHLELEITESCLMDGSDRGDELLRSIRSMGVRLGIDDFGTGYSSLAYLKRLPLNQLKIDRSFIHSVPKNPNDAAIASTIIAMARSLGLQSLAEGVENHAQLQFLRQQGCDAYQGFLYSAPVPADVFARSLRQQLRAVH